MKHIIGLMAMIFGFIGFAIHNIDAAHLCFGFAFILWCAVVIEEYLKYSKRKKLEKFAEEVPSYYIPQEIKERFTKEFMSYFLTRLTQVYKMYDFDEIPSYEEITNLEHTCGWNEAFDDTCSRYGMDDIYKYYDNLNWCDSDIFDGELTGIMVDYGLIKMGE